MYPVICPDDFLAEVDVETVFLRFVQRDHEDIARPAFEREVGERWWCCCHGGGSLRRWKQAGYRVAATALIEMSRFGIRRVQRFSILLYRTSRRLNVPGGDERKCKKRRCRRLIFFPRISPHLPASADVTTRRG